MRCLVNPGMTASVILRAQQSAVRRGHMRVAFLLRTVGMTLVGTDFVPTIEAGPGLMMPHPNGITIGVDFVVGSNVTIAQGVTAGAKHSDVPGAKFPVICDGAIIMPNAVLVGEIRIGMHAMVGANSVVLSDVPDYAVVAGIPARKIAEREPIIPGSYE